MSERDASNFSCMTRLLLLLVHMADLKPNVFFSQRPWWVRDNVFETLLGVRDCFSKVIA
jgi:hypothetical protein